MDFSIWDSSYYDEEHFTFSGGNDEEDLPFPSFIRALDPLEEEVKNNKARMQVFQIWIKKADQDILELEEDILMLKIQLLCDAEDWSEQISAVLRDRIHLLAILMQRLKVNKLGVEAAEVPPRLHDLLKPLLENYLAANPHQAKFISALTNRDYRELLTYNDLRAIARSRKVPDYAYIKKEQLQECLGLK